MVMSKPSTELLFSYGTLQLERVQLATFGRQLLGVRDALPCFTLESLTIHDANVIEISGKSEHTIAKFTGRESDLIPGTVFKLTAEDLENADKYEVADCARLRVTLSSGRLAWAYVDARSLS